MNIFEPWDSRGNLDLDADVVVVGSGAIAMQSMVLLLVFWTLHGKSMPNLE